MLLEVTGLAKSFVRPGLSPLRVVRGVSFAMERGETLAILGSSGCGKSTVGRCVLQLEKPDAGIVVLDGIPIHDRAAHGSAWRKRMQMVFQDPYGSVNPAFTARRTLADALRPSRLKGAALHERIVSLLDSVSLSERLLDSYPDEISGGQLQRLSIARAFASNPDFLFLDEPTSALDVSIRGQIVNLLAEFQESRNLGYLLVSHDVGVIRALSHRVIVMHAGEIVETGLTEDVLRNPAHAETAALLRGLDGADVLDPRPVA